MTMVHDILKQMPGLGQLQRKFLAMLFVTILVLRGRVNFRNLVATATTRNAPLRDSFGSRLTGRIFINAC
jgi:hypothetical protein